MRIADVFAQTALPGLTKRPTKSHIAVLVKEPCYISHDHSVEVQWDDDGFIETVIISCPATEGFGQHIRELGLGLSAMTSRSEVWSLLGRPSWSNEPSDSVLWDRFDNDHVAIHLQYDAAQMSISRVTIMSKAAAPDPSRDAKHH